MSSKASNGGKGAKSNGGKPSKGTKVAAQHDGAAARATLADEQAKLGAKGAAILGDMISWNAGPVDAPRADVRAILGAANMERLIPDVEPSTALTRAVGEGVKPSGMFTRRFASTESDAVASFGIYQATGGENETAETTTLGARVRVEASGAIVAAPPAGEPEIEACMSYARDIAARAARIVSHCAGKDVSGALVKLAAELHAVPLRNAGGFYMLPLASCDTWAALRPGLKGLGFEPITVRMYACPENLEAAQAAAAGALEAELGELVADLDKARTTGMQGAALERRVKLCDDMGAKVDLYASVLDSLGAEIKAKLGALHDEFQKKLDEDAAKVREGQPVHTPEVAAKLSSAAHKAWATRIAAGWTPKSKASAPATSATA